MQGVIECTRLHPPQVFVDFTGLSRYYRLTNHVVSTMEYKL